MLPATNQSYSVAWTTMDTGHGSQPLWSRMGGREGVKSHYGIPSGKQRWLAGKKYFLGIQVPSQELYANTSKLDSDTWNLSWSQLYKQAWQWHDNDKIMFGDTGGQPQCWSKSSWIPRFFYSLIENLIQHIIWVSYHILLTWIKPFWDDFPISNHDMISLSFWEPQVWSE